jgi:NAD+ diphosphatase
MAVNTFAGGTLDRAGEHRSDEAWVRARLTDPAARAVVVGREGVLVAEGDAPTAALLSPTLDDTPTLLGLQGDTPIFVIGLDEIEHPPGTRVAGLRETSASLPSSDAALLAYATALTEWQRRTQFCGVCGAPNRQAEAGHLMLCTKEGHPHHPRTDPVIIVLVTDGGDRALLGRQAIWPPKRWSCLAGFVEPGESLEEAVAREVDEEAGLQVTEATYVSSQPWPFPANLMLGFHAVAPGGVPTTRDAELEAVRWFTREEVALAHAAPDAPWTPADREPPAGIDFWLPPREAIARQLVAAWVDAG